MWGSPSKRPEHTRVSEALLENAGVANALLEGAMVAIVVTDRDGRIVFVNVKTEKLFGYHREELLGQTVEILVPERLRKAHLEHRVAYLSQPHMRPMGLAVDLVGRRKDGTEFPAEIGLSFMETEDGILVLSFIADISERKRRADDALRESEARFRSLVETTSDWVWEVDRNGVYTYASPKVRDLLGYEPEEVIGRTPFDLMVLDEADRVARFFHDVVKSRKPFTNFENTNLHKDGRPVILETSGVPILDARGNLVGYRGIDRDITERKRVEEAFQQAHRALHALIQASPVGIIALNLDGNVTMWNLAAEHIFGWSESEVLHHPPPFVPEDKQEEFRALHNRVLQGESLTGVEIRRQTRDGSTINLSLSTAPLRDARDDIIGVMGVVADITERKRVGEQLRLQASALESAANAITITDRDGTILWVNPAFTSLTGYTPEEAIGKTPRILKSGRHAESFYHDLWETILSGRVWTGEMINRRKDGRLYTEEQTITPVRDERGQISHFIAIKLDVSERKRLEEEAHQRERLEDIVRFKSEFIANVSHELRTPLNSIIGFSELLLHGVPGELNEKQAKYVNHILVSGQHLLALIIDILDLSKVDARKIELEVETLDITDALETTLTMVRPQASKKQISLTSEIASSISTITVDPLRFKQIMYNLLSNAVKFTCDGGQVHVTARVVHSEPVSGREPLAVNREPHGDWMEIAVQDTGIGISPDDQDKLFQAFSQVGRKHGSRQFGTGLGLALSKKLVELHGGRIWAESGGEGKGSTFFFALPVNRPPSSAETHIPPG